MTQKHTPEPWRVGDFDKTNIWADAPLGAMVGANTKTETDEANAERIVKCVNALAGLDDTQIEQLDSWLKKEATTMLFELVSKNRLLTKENERLRSTLQKVLDLDMLSFAGEEIVEEALKIK